MSTDLRDAIDASFGDGPPLPPPVARLAAGRAAVRRRRLGTVAGSSAIVAAIVVASFAVAGLAGGGSEETGSLAPGPHGTTGESAVREAERQAEVDRLADQAQRRAAQLERQRRASLVSRQFPASLDPKDGSLVVKRGWEVVRQVEEPVGYRLPEKSLGVVVTDGATTRWMLLTLDKVEGGVAPSASADDPDKGYTRFEDWLASMVELQGGPRADPLVVVSADDAVTAGPGATLVEVQEIEVIQGYTAPGDRVAEVRRDGRPWFAVIRGHGADAEVIPVDGAVLPESTLAALLTYLGQQARNGEGVR